MIHLNPNCSEYTYHLVLTPQERAAVIAFWAEQNLEDDDAFQTVLNAKTEKIEFTDEGVAHHYNKIKALILAERYRAGNITKEEFIEKVK